MANGTNVGSAYIQIIPSMEGVTGNISSLLGSEMQSAGAQGGENLGASMFQSILKSNIVTKIASLGLEGIEKGVQSALQFMKDVIQDYADFEQLQGGVQKLYGNMGMDVETYAKTVGKSVGEVKGEWSNLEKAQNLVMDNARNAYSTAGMDMNTYMENATSFSAALISSLNGDTVTAAAQTDVAMRAISDNWNTFGGDMQNVTNAYQGFAKQNYTMLDNLKLGYGGTKEEMQRLIDDANKWAEENGKAAGLTIDSFSDVVTAIDYIQQKQQIAGTTARESTETVSGSLNTLKAAWENLKIGLADPDADIGALVDAVIDAADVALQNLLPVINRALDGIAELLSELAPKIQEKLPGLLETLTPAITTGMESLIQIGATALTELAPVLLDALGQVINAVLEALEQDHPIIAGVLENLFVPGGVSSARGWDEYSNITNQHCMQMYDQYSGWFGKSEQVSGTHMSNMSNQAISASSSMLSGISGNMSSITNSVVCNAADMSASSAQSFSVMSKNIATSMADADTGVVNTSKNIKKSMTDVANSSKNTSKLSAEMTKLKTSGTNTSKSMSTLGSTIKKSMSNISSSFKKLTLSKDMQRQLKATNNIAKSELSTLQDSFKNTKFDMKQHIKVPHFSMSGSFNAEKGTTPKVNTKWYQAAESMPYLFNHATLFGAGEAKDEVLYGRAALKRDISEAVGGKGDITLNLNYDASDDATDMLRDLARGMKRYRMAGAF